MSDLADVVGELAAQLPQAHLQAWVRVLRETSEPGKTVAAQLIEAKPGYALAPKAMRLVEAWRTASPVPDGPALAFALQTAARIQDRRAAQRTDVVISGPGSDSASLIVADERIALVGSANLTDRALASNLELGVIIRDPDVALRIDRHFRSLMRSGSCILQRITT